MRLEMGTFPVERITFGPENPLRGRPPAGRQGGRRRGGARRPPHRQRRSGGCLPRRVRPHLAGARRDRAAHQGGRPPASSIPAPPGAPSPRWARGARHRLAGMGITEVSSVNWHDAGRRLRGGLPRHVRPVVGTHPAEPAHPPVRGRRARPWLGQRGPERRRAQGGPGGQRSGRRGHTPPHPAAAGSV